MEQQNAGMTAPSAGAGNKARPTFLTVLCIISFVGIALTVLFSLINLLINSSGLMQQVMQNNQSPMGTLIGNPDEYLSAQHVREIISLVSGLVCLSGVIMMWRLKRLGFFIYVLAELFPPVFALVMANKSGYGDSPIASFYVAILVISLIFALAFVAMYAVNLKHFKQII